MMIKALIVDDEYLVRYGLRQTIPWTDLGIEIVAEAEDGQEGWSKALEHRPEIILTDIKMPNVDGIEMMRMISNSGLDSVFIVLSGYGDFDYAKGAIRYGAIDYILKPVENEKLIETMQHTVKLLHSNTMINKLGKKKLIADLLSLLQQIQGKKREAASDKVQDALHYIHLHFAKDITVDNIATHLSISPYHLMRLFKTAMSETIVEYLTTYRIEQSKKYLLTRKYKIYEVAHMVGYADYRYFTKLFKRMTGLTPRKYIKSTLYD